MLKFDAWIAYLLLCLPLVAQDTQVLPDAGAAPPSVDTIKPVPPPEIPFATTGAVDPVMPNNLKIENYGGGTIEFIKDVGIRYSGPGIKVTGDNGMEIFSDSAVVDLQAKTATLKGHVSVYQGNILQRGDQTVYYYERKFLDASGLRASLDPILLEAGKFTVEDRGDKKVYVGENAGITTNDVEHPNYWLRARKTTIYPGDKIVFNDLRVFAGDIPVFWLPYLSQPLNAELGYHLVPGSRSSWGVFALNTYGVMLGGKTNPVTGENEDAWLLSRWHLDLRSRGVSVGVDFVDTRIENKEEITGLSFYYANDLDSETSNTGIPRGSVDDNRYNISLKNRWKLDFPDHADWRIDANLTLLSDRYYLQDFQPREFSINPEPDNTIGIFRRDDDSLLSLYARLRINDFYRTDTRLPEVSFDQSSAPLFGLPILHEGTTSFGLIGEQAADFTKSDIIDPLLKLIATDPAAQPLLVQLSGYERQLAEQLLALPLGDPRRAQIRDQVLDQNYARFNTYQEFKMPFMLGDFLSIAPQVGAAYTHYSAVEGPVDTINRTSLHFGTEASVKFSKDYGSYRNATWGLDGLKHIIQPHANWSYVSTNDFDPGDPFVDRLTPTTRPKLLDPARFMAVDDLQSWNIVRMGVRNRLLTKRDGQSYEWLYLDTYMDAFLTDPENLRDYSNLYNDMKWQPLPWLGVSVATQFPIVSGGSGFNEFESLMHFTPTDRFQFTLGYRNLNGHPVLNDSSAIQLQSYTRLTEDWGVGTRHLIEFDDSTLELEQYSLHRDLGNWVAGLGLSRRNNRLQKEYGIIFSLTLKEFPSNSLPLEIQSQ